MSTWAWVAVGLAGWILLSLPAALVLGRFVALSSWPGEAAGSGEEDASRGRTPAMPSSASPASRAPLERRRIAIVDDDPSLRALVAATLAGEEVELAEAASAETARDVVRLWKPDLVLLDVAMPGLDGLSLCRELKARPAAPAVVLVTGTELTESAAADAGADEVLAKPFSPLELVSVIERLAGAEAGVDVPGASADDQLLLYARDLNRLLEVERSQRRLLESAYRQTVTALATTLEARDTGTRLHSLRVTRYALALARSHDARLLSDQSLVYGFLLHDIGKIGLPDRILLKDGPLEAVERLAMQQHPVLGEEILGDVSLLRGEGLRIVRSHHERWDGAGYPDGLARGRIPAGARVFSVADALDAITSDRPYREAATWDVAVREIVDQAGRQFDPAVVESFTRAQPELRRVHDEIGAVAA